jgi:hypothetical protein
MIADTSLRAFQGHLSARVARRFPHRLGTISQLLRIDLITATELFPTALKSTGSKARELLL